MSVTIPDRWEVGPYFAHHRISCSAVRGETDGQTDGRTDATKYIISLALRSIMKIQRDNFKGYTMYFLINSCNQGITKLLGLSSL